MEQSASDAGLRPLSDYFDQAPGQGQRLTRPAPFPASTPLDTLNDDDDWLAPFKQPAPARQVPSHFLHPDRADIPDLATSFLSTAPGTHPPARMVPQGQGRSSEHVQHAGSRQAASPLLPIQQPPQLPMDRQSPFQDMGFIHGDPSRPGHQGHPAHVPLSLPEYQQRTARPLPDLSQHQQQQSAGREALEPLARPPRRIMQGPTITDGSPNIALDDIPGITSASPAVGALGPSADVTGRRGRISRLFSARSSRFLGSQSYGSSPAGRPLSASGRSPSNASLMMLTDRMMTVSTGTSPAGSSSPAVTSLPTAAIPARTASPGGLGGRKRDSPDPEPNQQDVHPDFTQPIAVSCIRISLGAALDCLLKLRSHASKHAFHRDYGAAIARDAIEVFLNP